MQHTYFGLTNLIIFFNLVLPITITWLTSKPENCHTMQVETRKNLVPLVPALIYHK